ncbi:hypothetical protein [Acinetobacter bereziniae]|uniref:hypothetical protein n=1 Tax=Acinetobacter bereziniae TaxID=106648 RepID=UPI0018DDDC26|nr:hypothetical protein [Acinetobacter bereziniae]MBI0396889.1 hypothetical protein [Acinetobacter bereziniae]MBJ8445663.1 hypothetical protein [Acinetobacter bereziniae]MDV8154443.1 hypothetical protein [Acinetobacter bereziniae]
MHKFSKIELVTQQFTYTIEDYLTLKMSCDGTYIHHTKKDDKNFKIEVLIDPPSDVLEVFRNIAHEIKDYLDQIDYQGKFEFKFIV